jgi:hypothetical protein
MLLLPGLIPRGRPGEVANSLNNCAFHRVVLTGSLTVENQ